MTITEILPGVKKNIRLGKYTTFKIGGPAKYFYAARTKADILRALRASKKLNLPYFVLGQGSNVLISDKGFPGLVIKIQNTKYKIQNTRLYAEAGVPFPVLVREAGKRGLAGLEWAGGLPGTLGGAVRGNAGAFGGETKDTIVSVEALDGNLKIIKLYRQGCAFGYRSSVFKKKNWIVLSALMRFKKGDKKKIQAISKDHIRYRKEKGPLDLPNAGSIFKNCDLRNAPERAKKRFVRVIKNDPFPVIPTAALLADAGLKNLRVGGALISPKHPNFIVNADKAKAQDVLALINLVKEKIKRKYGIVLEEEIKMVGLDPGE